MTQRIPGWLRIHLLVIAVLLAMSALRPEADIWAGLHHFCFGPGTEVSALRN